VEEECSAPLPVKPTWLLVERVRIGGSRVGAPREQEVDVVPRPLAQGDVQGRVRLEVGPAGVAEEQES
jgi:hypothetical protein